MGLPVRISGNVAEAQIPTNWATLSAQTAAHPEQRTWKTIVVADRDGVYGNESRHAMGEICNINTYGIGEEWNLR